MSLILRDSNLKFWFKECLLTTIDPTEEIMVCLPNEKLEGCSQESYQELQEYINTDYSCTFITCDML